jgi:hypothetical protein
VIWERLLRRWHGIRGGTGNLAAGALDSSTPKLKRFCVLGSVLLREPIAVTGTGEGGAGVAVGYYRNFGVTAAGEQSAHMLVEKCIPDGTVSWSDSETKELSDSDVRKLIGRKPPLDLEAFRAESSGIWYESGHMFYPGE